MKTILCCILYLLLLSCESEKAITQDGYILVEAPMTNDMQKIKELYVNRLRKDLRGSFDEVIFGKRVDKAS